MPMPESFPASCSRKRVLSLFGSSLLLSSIGKGLGEWNFLMTLSFHKRKRQRKENRSAPILQKRATAATCPARLLFVAALIYKAV